MQIQDAPHFRDPLRMLVGPVAAGNDDFALRTVEMAAPIGNDAVAADGFSAVQVSSQATVSQNRVIGNAFGEGKFIEVFHETVLRVEEINTVRHSLQWRSGGGWFYCR